MTARPVVLPQPTDDVSPVRAADIFAQLCALSRWPAGRPTLLVDDTVDERELGYADYGTRTVHLSPVILARSEDHVASLLAHELGHLFDGPAAPSPRRRRTALALVLAGILCVLVGAMSAALSTAESGRHWWTLPLVFGGALLALCGPATSLSLSRRAEMQADRYAVALLRDTPWDATAILRDVAEASGGLRLLPPVRLVARLFATHPAHRRRRDLMNRH